MPAKTRNLLILVAVVVLSVMVWSVVAAQDATSTAEPNPATAEASPLATTEPSAPAAAHPFLGVSLQDSANGVTVAQVVDGSAAATAGIKVGDVITAVDNKTVTSAAEVASAIAAHAVGDQVTIEVTRDGNQVTMSATLGEQPAQMPLLNPPMQPNNQPGQPNNRPGRGQGRGNSTMPMFGFQYNSADLSWTVNNLPESSPLYTAGLRQGDVIKTIDGKSYDPQGLVQYLQSLAADAKVTLSVDRDGQTQDIQVSLSDLKPMAAFGGFGGFGGLGNLDHDFGQMMPFFQSMYGNGHLGVTFQTIDADVAKANNLTVTDGALVTEVEAGSPAEKAGLKVNDVITAVDGDKVDQERTLRDRLIAYEPGDTVTLTVLRDGQSQDIQATLDQPQMPSMGGMFGGGNFPFNFNFQGPRGFRFGQPGQNSPQATPEATPNL